MKLELKHLAPYLPYKLKAIDSDGNIDIVTCIDIEEIDGYKIKPILRPLSDLKKEITYNRENFVPIDWLEDKYYTLSLHKECERLLELDGYQWTNRLSCLLLLHLFEWHFDVFRLIEKGLVVDINTLQP
jgi:hypothetical protein